MSNSMEKWHNVSETYTSNFYFWSLSSTFQTNMLQNCHKSIKMTIKSLKRKAEATERNSVKVCWKIKSNKKSSPQGLKGFSEDKRQLLEGFNWCYYHGSLSPWLYLSCFQKEEKILEIKSLLFMNYNLWVSNCKNLSLSFCFYFLKSIICLFVFCFYFF